jgi:hypothetical protein
LSAAALAFVVAFVAAAALLAVAALFMELAAAALALLAAAFAEAAAAVAAFAFAAELSAGCWQAASDSAETAPAANSSFVMRLGMFRSSVSAPEILRASWKFGLWGASGWSRRAPR